MGEKLNGVSGAPVTGASGAPVTGASGAPVTGASGAPVEVHERKWTRWSVVSSDDGTLRCKRMNAEDEKDVEYVKVPRPVFSPDELAGMIGFGKLELLESDRIADLCYERRYRMLAFRLCSELNTPAPGTGV